MLVYHYLIPSENSDLHVEPPTPLEDPAPLPFLVKPLGALAEGTQLVCNERDDRDRLFRYAETLSFEAARLVQGLMLIQDDFRMVLTSEIR